MRLSKILLGQAIRLATGVGDPKAPFHGGNVHRAFEARYGFFQGPRVLEDFDPAKGITYSRGIFEGSIIDKCQVFSNGIIVNTQAATEVADRFIDDAIRWIGNEPGISITEGARAYLSEMEVYCDYPLSKALARFESFGKLLGDTTASYGQNSSEYKLSGLHFFADVATFPTPKPVAFIFDRRTDQPWDSGLYFASAPLRTSDHLKFLEEFEGLITTL